MKFPESFFINPDESHIIATIFHEMLARDMVTGRNAHS